MILWQQLIAERNKSGKTIAQWCADNNISKHKYYYWNNKINERQSDADEVNFAEITHINSVSDNIVVCVKFLWAKIKVLRYYIKIYNLSFLVNLILIH